MMRIAAIGLGLALVSAAPIADVCTRILYESGAGAFIVGRTMDLE
jgi:penicillin V acylase-like amidase (Ntn superfamily)